MNPQMEQAAKLRLEGSKSYSQIGAAMGITKWQARDLVKRSLLFLDGYGAGFKAATAFRSDHGEVKQQS